MCDVKQVADEAQIVVNGYAFTKDKANIRVLNLNRPDQAAVLSELGEVIETSMDDVELDIVKEYFQRNKKYMEV